MDLDRLDSLARSVAATGSRRSLLGHLTTLPVLGGLLALLDSYDAQSAGRRKRRKKAHKHGKGRRRKHNRDSCKAESVAQTCASKCGSVTNNCKKTVDCGSCACTPACDVCFTCDEQGTNTPGTCGVDPAQVGDVCGAGGAVCQDDGSCVAPPVITNFTASPTTIDRGATPPETSLLSWTTSNATTCTLDDGSGPVTVNCTDSLSVGPSATATYTLSASGAGGGPVTDEFTVTVEYCHPIQANGGACPSGVTEYCQATPIVATSSDAAKAACETCSGSGVCGNGVGPVGGSIWSTPSPVTFFYYSAAAGPICGGYIPQAGDITHGAACQLGRWAP